MKRLLKKNCAKKSLIAMLMICVMCAVLLTGFVTVGGNYQESNGIIMFNACDNLKINLDKCAYYVINVSDESTFIMDGFPIDFSNDKELHSIEVTTDGQVLECFIAENKSFFISKKPFTIDEIKKLFNLDFDSDTLPQTPIDPPIEDGDKPTEPDDGDIDIDPPIEDGDKPTEPDDGDIDTKPPIEDNDKPIEPDDGDIDTEPPVEDNDKPTEPDDENIDTEPQTPIEPPNESGDNNSNTETNNKNESDEEQGNSFDPKLDINNSFNYINLIYIILGIVGLVLVTVLGVKYYVHKNKKKQ